ncbi:copper(I)-binding protein [Caulobacter ginsengisoli]|uniref:Copper(I)-binding protein n=1 Tax=Caulobacter ginsengisoli TaxID=400775 RepID=A0ABU0IWY0_9CAUL|nr:copper chaperone PCu(A)C [Caulobacter ginsengisoli]MDQ0466527.1 copper(I)-binding protein [Caulobacter ginsengisoli]
MPNLSSDPGGDYVGAMITRRRLAAVSALFLTSAALLFAHGAAGAAASALTIQHPWSRPATAGGVGVGYFTILNPGKTPDRLLRVETAAAQWAGLHVSQMRDGMMTMDEIKGGVRIDAGGRVDFQPGGLHVMFIGLKKPQKVGDVLPATLVFEKAGRIKVDFKVETGAPPKPMADMPGMKH